MIGDSEKDASTIRDKARRLQKARGGRRGNAWLGLGMFGMVGWAVAVPTVVGIALGLFIDARWPGEMSWTLALLLGGVALGCLNAWYWVQREAGKDD